MGEPATAVEHYQLAGEGLGAGTLAVVNAAAAELEVGDRAAPSRAIEALQQLHTGTPDAEMATHERCEGVGLRGLGLERPRTGAWPPTSVERA